MTERCQEVSSFSKCRGKFLLAAAVGLIIFCFTATIATLVLIFVLFCPRCSSPNSLVSPIYWGAAIFLLCIGVTILVVLVYLRKRRIISDLQAEISRVPVAGFEKSPTAVFINNHISHRRPCDGPSSPIDLLDYFTAVQDTWEVNSSINVDDALLEEFPRTPPPCYEKALELAVFVRGHPVASNGQDVFEQLRNKQFT